MRKHLLIVATSLALAIGAAPSFAAGKGAEKSGGGGYLYRYKNDKGVLVMESSIPPEYATKGYQILTRSGQLVQDVPASTAPALDDATLKAKREQDALMSRKDSELRKLYSSPQDAERLRDRQVEAITLKIDYAKGQLLQTSNKRKAELEQAARLERKGTPVPAPMKDSLDRLNRQVLEQEAQVKQLEADRERVRGEFDPIIERLKVIYPNKVAPAAAAPATPATPAVPGAAPAVPAKPAAPAR